MNAARAAIEVRYTGIGRGLAGPIVHAAHGNGRNVLGSLALEAGLPLFTGGVGFAMLNGTSFGDGSFTAGILMVVLVTPVAAITGTIIDSSVLAVETTEVSVAKAGRFVATPYAMPLWTRDERTGERRPAMTFGVAGPF